MTDASLDDEDPWGLTHEDEHAAEDHSGPTADVPVEPEADAEPAARPEAQPEAQPDPVFLPTAAGAVGLETVDHAADGEHDGHANHTEVPETVEGDEPDWSAWAPRVATPPATHVPTPSRSRRPLVIGAVVLVVVAVIVAVVVSTSGGGTPQPSATPPSVPADHPAPGGATPGDEQIARAVNLNAADLPSGWTVDAASPYFPAAGAQSLAQTPADRRAAAALASCLAIGSAANPLSVPAVLDRTSPAYRAAQAGTGGTTAPAPITEMESSTQVLSSPAQVQTDIATLTRSRFAACFGQAMTPAFQTTASSGAQVGSPHISDLTIEQWPGVRAVGVDLSAPASGSGSADSLDMHFVFIAGGRVETLLTGASVGQPFPLLVTAKAAYDIEQRVAANAAG